MFWEKIKKKLEWKVCIHQDLGKIVEADLGKNKYPTRLIVYDNSKKNSKILCTKYGRDKPEKITYCEYQGLFRLKGYCPDFENYSDTEQS